jgi:hypothetical protein
MKKNPMFLLSLSLIVLASGVSAFGQDKQPAQDKEFTFERGLVMTKSLQGQEPVVTLGGNTFTYVNSEFSFDRLVKGAPYSAQAVTEMTQILSDGNRIVNTSTAAVYRDGEGRTRREQTLKAIGPFAPSGEPLKSISINDPVAGVAYVLEPHSHMARKIQGLRIESGGAGAGGFKVNSSGGEGGNVMFARTANGEVQVRTATAESKMREEKERTGFRKEDLGTQTVEGVSAVGTKTTITIPAGQIGNERAIEIVDERWFSQELQTMVMTRHTDPRSGESVYRLTNISRTEPDHSLFEVPSDYTLRDDQPMRFKMEKQEKQVP